MIAFVEGTLSDFLDDSVIVNVGGIGFEVRVSGETMQRLMATGTGENIKLYTYLYQREDQMALYGFLSRGDLSLFKKLITVSGIGPRGGLALLSTMDADDLRFAIISGDVKMISRAPGIGKRTAERLILDLRDKLSKEAEAADYLLLSGSDAGMYNGSEEENSPASDAVEALVALGYGRSEAAAAVKKCADAGDTEAILKAALRELF